MVKNNEQTKSFNVYRYQILPVSSQLEFNFHGKLLDFEELRARKNSFFEEILRKVEAFKYDHTEIIHKLESLIGGIAVFRVGVNRGLKRETKEFTKEHIDNWPTVLVVFNNDPSVQKIAIEVNKNAFRKTDTFVNILMQNLNDLLFEFRLHVHFKPIFEKRDFWSIINKNQGKVINANFELISPNMSNISKSLTFDLAALYKGTNTQITNLELNSDKNSCLNFSENDEFVNGLVNYSSDGGGTISLKVRGIRKKIKTANSIKEITIKEAEISSANPEEISKIFGELIND